MKSCTNGQPCPTAALCGIGCYFTEAELPQHIDSAPTTRRYPRSLAEAFPEPNDGITFYERATPLGHHVLHLTFAVITVGLIACLIWRFV